MDEICEDLLLLIFKNIDDLNDIKNILSVNKIFNKNMEKIKIEMLLNHKNHDNCDNCDKIYTYLTKIGINVLQSKKLHNEMLELISESEVLVLKKCNNRYGIKMKCPLKYNFNNLNISN